MIHFLHEILKVLQNLTHSQQCLVFKVVPSKRFEITWLITAYQHFWFENSQKKKKKKKKTSQKKWRIKRKPGVCSRNLREERAEQPTRDWLGEQTPAESASCFSQLIRRNSLTPMGSWNQSSLCYDSFSLSSTPAHSLWSSDIYWSFIGGP